MKQSKAKGCDVNAGAGGDRPQWIASAENDECSGRETDHHCQGVMICGPHHRNAARQDEAEGNRNQSLFQ
jgi:hypothetical protein